MSNYSISNLPNLGRSSSHWLALISSAFLEVRSHAEFGPYSNFEEVVLYYSEMINNMPGDSMYLLFAIMVNQLIGAHDLNDLTQNSHFLGTLVVEMLVNGGVLLEHFDFLCFSPSHLEFSFVHLSREVRTPYYFFVRLIADCSPGV